MDAVGPSCSTIPGPLNTASEACSDSWAPAADDVVFVADGGGFKATRSGGKQSSENSTAVAQPSAVHLMSLISAQKKVDLQNTASNFGTNAGQMDNVS